MNKCKEKKIKCMYILCVVIVNTFNIKRYSVPGLCILLNLNLKYMEKGLPSNTPLLTSNTSILKYRIIRLQLQSSSCRLAINLVCTLPSDNIPPLRFDDIFNRCSGYFVAQTLAPPTKSLLSKQIVTLFHTENVTLREKGDRYSAYKNLKFRAPMSNTESIIVPDHCSAITTKDNELKISCNREFIVNGKQLSCITLFGVNKTYLKVNDTPVSLNIHIQPCQETVAGMVFLMENLKLCKGAPCDALYSNCEKWATIINSTIYDYRKRSNTCPRFLSFGSKMEFCEPCVQKQKRDFKQANRVASNDKVQSEKCLKRKGESECSIPPNDKDQSEKSLKIKSDSEGSIASTDKVQSETEKCLKRKGDSEGSIAPNDKDPSEICTKRKGDSEGSLPSVIPEKSP